MAKKTATCPVCLATIVTDRGIEHIVCTCGKRLRVRPASRSNHLRDGISRDEASFDMDRQEEWSDEDPYCGTDDSMSDDGY